MVDWSNVDVFFPTPQCNLNAESGEPEDEMTPEAVEFCRRVGSDATRVSELAGGRDRAVNAAVQEGIDRVNQRAASNAQRVQKWTILGRDFSITSGELGKCGGLFSPARAESRLNGRNSRRTGPTMKLKRPSVVKMYKEEIEEFYKEVATPLSPDEPRQ